MEPGQSPQEWWNELSPSAKTDWLTDLSTAIQVMHGIQEEDLAEDSPDYATLDEAIRIVSREQRNAHRSYEPE